MSLHHHLIMKTVELNAIDWNTLRLIKNFARISLGFVWAWEGLVPKILVPSPLQIEMVIRSGWWWGSPSDTLYWLGVAQLIAGLAIMSGLWERLAVLVASLSLLVLMVLVVVTHPLALVDPFGGFIKDGCLFACAAFVWWFPSKGAKQELLYPRET